jgi:HPt (histidine-containing phosphotransfer) domain-containing protein
LKNRRPSPALNAASLNALRALDPSGGNAFVQRVLSTYLRSMDKHLDNFEQARARADVVGLRAVAHTLKSSSESVGAIDFARKSAQLEAQLRELGEPVGQGASSLMDLGPELTQYAQMAQQVRLLVQAELDRDGT